MFFEYKIGTVEAPGKTLITLSGSFHLRQLWALPQNKNIQYKTHFKGIFRDFSGLHFEYRDDHEDEVEFLTSELQGLEQETQKARRRHKMRNFERFDKKHVRQKR